MNRRKTYIDRPALSKNTEWLRLFVSVETTWTWGTDGAAQADGATQAE